MTELFEPNDREKELQSDDEEQGGRDLVVQLFFFIIFAGAITLFVHWLKPNQGWHVYAGIMAGSYYATWLLRKFRNRD